MGRERDGVGWGGGNGEISELGRPDGWDERERNRGGGGVENNITGVSMQYIGTTEGGEGPHPRQGYINMRGSVDRAGVAGGAGE